MLNKISNGINAMYAVATKGVAVLLISGLIVGTPLGSILLAAPAEGAALVMAEKAGVVQPAEVEKAPGFWSKSLGQLKAASAGAAKFSGDKWEQTKAWNAERKAKNAEDAAEEIAAQLTLSTAVTAAMENEIARLRLEMAQAATTAPVLRLVCEQGGRIIPAPTTQPIN